ncbi:MAG: PPC domain-containing protein [Planctomycetes bacterium]|nr:PPC domain-containing protein [Planctomycetota bacterium]
MLAAAPLWLALSSWQAPQVERMTVCGGQRGTEVAVTLTGKRLFEPQGLLLEQPGIEVLAIQSDKPEQCTMRLQLAADCPLGLQPLRLRTAYGLSNLLQFEIGVLPEVAEQRQGDAAQAVPLGCTVNGSLRGEEIDRYAVEVTAGMVVQCEVMAIRLGRANLDLALQVHGPDGRLLAAADDTALGHKDPWLSFVAPGTGTCVVTVRGAFADEANAGPYRLHLGTFPRPIGCLPSGGQPGETLAIALLEDPATGAGAAPFATTLPSGPEEWFRWFPTDARGTAPTPLLLRVGGPPNRAPETDANGRAWVEFPASVSGVVAEPEQPATFHWRGQKGVALEFRALARALRSPLDPVLSVRDAAGRLLAENDDAAGLDSVLRFTPPADGEYRIEVQDLLRRGSARHFFRLEGGPRAEAPSLRLVVGRREEAVLAVARGNRRGAVLQWSGLEPKHELVLLAQDLPPGVTAEFGPIVPGTNLVPMVLTAAADAALGASQVALRLRAVTPPHERDPGFLQTLPLVQARNDQPLVVATTRRLPVAVAAAAPFAVEVVPPAVPIVRGAPLALEVRIHRTEGFAEPVRVRSLWSSPGLSSGQIEIAAASARGLLPFDASGGAPVGRVRLLLVGEALSRGGRVEVCSDWLDLQVDAPWLSVEVGKVRTKTGTEAAMRVQYQTVRPLVGTAEAVLLGLPRGVTAAPVRVALATAGEFVFPLQVAADAAPGRHRSVVVQVRVPSSDAEGAPLVEHRFPAGELRIDAPASVPATAAGAAAGGKEGT